MKQDACSLSEILSELLQQIKDRATQLIRISISINTDAYHSIRVIIFDSFSFPFDHSAQDQDSSFSTQIDHMKKIFLFCIGHFTSRIRNIEISCDDGGIFIDFGFDFWSRILENSLFIYQKLLRRYLDEYFFQSRSLLRFLGQGLLSLLSLL